MSRDDMFARWSARRARVASEEAAKDPVPEAVEPDLPDPQTEEEEDALLASLGLPRPEDVAGPEIRKFLAKGVPEIFRRRALRALWRSDPTFAVLDGLNDYDEDFNLPEFNQKVIATAYKVGRGIVREIEVAVASDDPEENEDADDIAQGSDEGTPETDSMPEAIATAAETDERPMDDPVDASEPVFAPRRMTFDT